MRTLVKNKQPIYYALYNGMVEDTDASNAYTGEMDIHYGNVQLLMANVSAERGLITMGAYGMESEYSRSFVTYEDCGIDSETVFFLDYGLIDDFSAQTAYPAESYCIHNGWIYKAKVAVPAGEWDSSAWEEERPNYKVEQISKSLNHYYYRLKEIQT